MKTFSVVDSLYKRIEAGRNGDNKGISTGLIRLDKYTFGIQRGFMSTIFGDSGSGKTSYALYTHVFKPLIYASKHPEEEVNILYFSLELSSEVLMAKLLCLYIFETYSIVISYDELFSFNEKLSDEKLQYVINAKSWLELIDSKITIYDKSISAGGVKLVTRAWASNFGKFEENNNQEWYIPNNPKQYLIVIVDHIKLLEYKISPKDEIDKCCDILVSLRNKCKLTIAIVQQANRQFKSMSRRDNGFTMLQTDDMSDSSGPAQASELIIGLFHPHREKMSRVTVGDVNYDIKILRSRARVIQILKNRFGISDILDMTFFLGEVGYFEELPAPQPGVEFDYDDIMTLHGKLKPTDTNIISSNKSAKVDMTKLTGNPLLTEPTMFKLN